MLLSANDGMAMRGVVRGERIYGCCAVMLTLMFGPVQAVRHQQQQSTAYVLPELWTLAGAAKHVYTCIS